MTVNRHDRSRLAVVSLVYLALGIVMTWPLLANAADMIVESPGDNLHFAWMIGWFDQALFDRGLNPYFAPDLNYPQGWELAHSEIPLPLVLFGMPLSRLANPILGYNLAVFITFPLTAILTYWWMRKLGVGRLPSFFSGAAFAFTPYRMAHFRAGHMNMLATMWFPIFLVGFYDLIGRQRVSIRRGLLAGVGYGLISLSSQYYFYLTTVVMLGVVVVVAGWRLLRRAGWRPPWTGWLAAGAAGAPLALAGVLPYLLLQDQGDLAQRTVDAVSGGSASLSDYILPSTDHFLFGSWVTTNFSRNSWIEGSLYLGVAVLLLALFAVWRRSRLPSGQRRVVPLLALTVVLAGALSLGTHLYWNEAPVRLSLPGVAASALGRNEIGIRLPGYVLYQVLPFFDRLRTFKRAAVLVLLPMAALAGIGLNTLLIEVRPRRRQLVSGIALAVLLFEIYPGPLSPWHSVAARPVDRWLNQQPSDGAVAVFPFRFQEDQREVYASLDHGKPILGGFFSAFPPEQYRETEPVLSQFPEPSALVALRRLPVDYVVVIWTGEYERGQVDQLLSEHGWQRSVDFADRTAYFHR